MVKSFVTRLIILFSLFYEKNQSSDPHPHLLNNLTIKENT